MFSRLRIRRRARKALQDVNLQKALGRASFQHNQRYLETSREIPWDEYKQKARAIREKNVGRLPELVERFTREAQKAGANVHRASGPQEAVDTILRIAREKKARLIVKSKSMVSEEIGLNDALEKSGFQVVETDLGEWIIQLAGDRPSHITAPALHLTKERIAEILTRRLGRVVAADAREIVRIAREEMRKHFINADIGISGANFAIAESGTLVVVSNEGNVRLTTTLPPVHIAVVTAEKFVETLEEAAVLLKVLTVASAGKKLTSYVSFITGPSSTTDIEKEPIVGVHGPEEVHIIILDGGRLALAESEDFKDILYCLKCGGCMLVCPVFQSVGGHVFGGPVYPGGIGTLLTAMTRSLGESYRTLGFCADCKKCEDFCPVGILTGDLLLKLKDLQGAGLREKGLSWLFKSKALSEKGASLLAVLQKVWQKEGYLRRLPLVWTRGKRIPVLKPQKNQPEARGKGPKAYLFQGCLVKYFFPEVRESVLKSLAHFGYRVVVPPEQVCCGAPSLHLGDAKAVRALAKQNLESFAREDPDVIITVCPTGHSLLKNHYPRIDPRAARFSGRVQDYTAFLASRGHLPQSTATGKREVYYHYPCHYLNELRPGDTPPLLLRALGFDLAEQKEPPSCCGFCGVFSARNPEISAHLWGKKKEDILKSGASLVATDCPGCLFQLRSGLETEAKHVRAYHTAEILAGLLEEISPFEKAESRLGRDCQGKDFKENQ
ncbi:MAG TPA: LUD domain-containing protein [Candidatus Desulfaltia sp.]|nr:LUD domain-containing protein [Candidatus Desulfaltia sp.]